MVGGTFRIEGNSSGSDRVGGGVSVGVWSLELSESAGSEIGGGSVEGGGSTFVEVSLMGVFGSIGFGLMRAVIVKCVKNGVL